MDKNKKWMITLSGLLLSVLIIFELIKPESIDWSLDFRSNSKKPNGCYVYVNALKTLQNEKRVEINNLNLLDYVEADSIRSKGILLYVTDGFDCDSVETDRLLSCVKNGRALFISALSFSKSISDTLGFRMSFSPFFQLKQKTAFRLKYAGGDTDKYYHFNDIQRAFFSGMDTLRTCILGTDSLGNANFISMRMGRGIIFLHLAPQVFTNNQMLYENKDYALTLTSYFAGETIYWDDYLKPGNVYRNGAPSPLRFVLSDTSLRAAYLLFLLTIFLLILLESKRQQQIIPVLSKPVNASLEFINIITGLYLSSADNLKMAEKKYTFFCDYIRTRYFLSSIPANDDFYVWLAEKSGTREENIRAIFIGMTKLKQKQRVANEELVQYVKHIDDFYDCIEGAKTNRQKT